MNGWEETQGGKYVVREEDLFGTNKVPYWLGANREMRDLWFIVRTMMCIGTWDLLWKFQKQSHKDLSPKYRDMVQDNMKETKLQLLFYHW